MFYSMFHTVVAQVNFSGVIIEIFLEKYSFHMLHTDICFLHELSCVPARLPFLKKTSHTPHRHLSLCSVGVFWHSSPAMWYGVGMISCIHHSEIPQSSKKASYDQRYISFLLLFYICCKALFG